jgi:hypothetical protein
MTLWFPHADPQKNPLVLVEIDGYDPSTGTVKTLRFSNGRDVHNSGIESNPRTPWPGRLVTPGSIVIDLITAWTKGLAPTGLSEIQLSNSDGGLDYLRPWTFDGRGIRIYSATIETITAPQLTKTLIFDGKMEQPDISRRTMTVPLRNQSYYLDKPARTLTFAGTGDSEGAADVAGKIKPYVYGYASNIPLILLDSARLIYFVCLNGIPQSVIRDSGVSLVAHTNQLTYAALKAATVPAAQYDYFYGDVTTPGIYVKLGSTPAGQMTVDSIKSSGTFDAGGTLTGCITQIMVDAGLPIPSFINDVNYGLPNVCGRYIDDDSTYLDILGDLISNVAGWIWYNPLGFTATNPRWVIGQLPKVDTGGVTRAVITDADIIDMVRLGNPKTPGEGIPPQSLIFEQSRNYTVQTSGLAGSSPVSWRAFVAAAYRQGTKTDTSVLTRYPLAQTVKITARASSELLPGTGTYAPLDDMWTALQLGYEYYQVTVKFKPALFQVYQDTNSNAWVPAAMPAFGLHRLGIRTSRFGFLNTGKGTQVAPMYVGLDFQRKRITYIVRTTYQAA